jgi:hypothetical protein
MKNIAVITLLMCSAAAQADVKLLVEFDGEQHKIVRVDKFETNRLMQQATSFNHKKSQDTVLLSYQKGTEWVNIELSDPRIRRAPLSQDGSGHEQVLLKTGLYTVTLKGDDIDLKSVTMQLPNSKAKTRIEYAVIQ